ncbi:MAG: class I SAM-dependent methyltransferase [Anaerolineaceae bacterium]
MSTLPIVDEVIQQVLEKKKYKHLDPDLVAFIASKEVKKRTSLKEAVKATTNKLHQVGWAYFNDQPAYSVHASELAALPQDLHATECRAFCTRLMQEHASTRERLPVLSDFYRTLLADIQPVHSILDLACGFNPLAVDWMPIEKTATYNACDIFQDMANFLQIFFDHFHVTGKASLCNLLTHIPQEKAQVALLLKTLPCLEQVEKDSARRILTGIQAQYLIVSFPVRSIGGKEKGMLAHYSSQFENLLADLGWNYTKFLFTSELAYRVERGN